MVGVVVTFVVVVGIKAEDSVVGGSVFDDTVVVGIEVEGKAAPVVAGRAEFFKRVVSGFDDPSEEPQAESTTNTVTSKNLFMSEY